MSVKVVAAINSMNKQGHYARVYRHQNKMWVEIDESMLAEYQLEEEFGCGIRPAVKAAPRSILGQSPSQVLGLFFFTSRGNSFLRPVLRKKSIRDEFVNKNLRETLDCSHWHTRGMLPDP